jgi:hypothetical protein
MSLFLVAASLFSVFNIEKGEDARGTGAGYPYTGGGLKYAHSIPNHGEVANLSPTAAHNRSCARSSQEIRGQRN